MRNPLKIVLFNALIISSNITLNLSKNPSYAYEGTDFMSYMRFNMYVHVMKICSSRDLRFSLNEFIYPEKRQCVCIIENM